MLLDLPSEILVQILLNLTHSHPPSVIHCASACRALNVILRHSILLQYHLLLTRSGLVDIPSAAFDLATRLNCLKEYRARWQTLEWAASYSFPFEPNHLWGLSGGVFARGGTGLESEATTINFRQLMSISSSQDMQQWSIKANVPVRDFGFDHPSELVVLLHEIRSSATTAKTQLAVHLRSICSGGAHPCAAHSILYHDLSVPHDNQVCTYAIQIHGALLVILIRPITGNMNELVIWNWESGHRLLYMSSEEQVISAFAVLQADGSDGHIMAVRTPREERHMLPHLDVFSFGDHRIPCQTKSYRLPELRNTVEVSSLRCTCDPVPRPTKSSRPFYTDWRRRLCVLSFTVFAQVGDIFMREYPHSLIFFTDALLEDDGACFISPTLGGRPRNPVILPWNAWSHRTRLTGWRCPPHWSYWVFGSKVIRRLGPHARNKWTLQICDFNTYLDYPKDIRSSITSTSRYVHADIDGVLINRHVFKNEEVHTGGLSYYEVSTQGLFPAETMMVDHDNVYIAKDVQARSRELEVLAF